VKDKMRDYISLAVLLAVFLVSLNTEANMNSSTLAVSITCRDNPGCIFEGKDLILDVFVKNNTVSAIGLPLPFLKKKGLHCFLVDNASGKKITLGVSLTPESLTTDFVKLAPGEKIKLSRKISADLVRSIREKMVSLTANVAVAGMMEPRDGEQPVEFVEKVEIVIRGKDKIDFDNNQ
jgi:hypothetical protein